MKHLFAVKSTETTCMKPSTRCFSPLRTSPGNSLSLSSFRFPWRTTILRRTSDSQAQSGIKVDSSVYLKCILVNVSVSTNSCQEMVKLSSLNINLVMKAVNINDLIQGDFLGWSVSPFFGGKMVFYLTPKWSKVFIVNTKLLGHKWYTNLIPNQSTCSNTNI